jgi:hypothetical protein
MLHIAMDGFVKNFCKQDFIKSEIQIDFYTNN